ncbi:MAG: ABC transporter permease [Pirellulaceae bacterium]
MNLLRVVFRVVHSLTLFGTISATLPLEAAFANGPYLVISSRRPDSDRSALPMYGLTRNDLHYMLEFSTVRFAAPIRAIRTQVRVLDRQADAVVLGTTEKLFNVMSDRHAVRIQSGRYLSAADVTARNNVAVLAEPVAADLFRASDPIGRSVKVHGHYFLVVGTFRGKTDPDSNKALPGGMHIPLTTMRARFGDRFFSDRQGRREGVRFELSQIWLAPTTPSALAPTRRMVESLLGQAHETMDYSIDMVR